MRNRGLVITGGLLWLWQIVIGAIRVGGDIDFVVERSKDLGWVADMLGILIDPPGWAVFPAILVGLALVLFGLRRGVQEQKGPKMDPMHLISVGMAGVLFFAAIALAGVIWQHFQSTAPEAAATNGLQTNENEERETWPKTSAYDLPIKLAVIDKLMEIVGQEKEWEQLARRGDLLARDWKKHFDKDGPKKFLADLEAYRQECEAMLNKIGSIRRDNEKYQDIWTITGPKLDSSITKELRDFMEAIRNIGDPPSGNYDFFITPYAASLRDYLKQFGRWRFDMEKALFNRRTELSG